MSWAKYMEDDMDIIQERNPEWNNCYFSYPQTQVISCQPIKKQILDFDYISDLLAEVLDFPVIAETTYKDRKLLCKCCGRPFLFTASSQKHFAKKGWNPPKRCKNCRSVREATYCMRPSF